ncbi:ribonuclease III domain-containing protein [Cristinia sonorae]|uniref:Ribonuclease III domain-containing protein n=1 Tax=Cristinia sonorae TaxID=1940300 RepID=A0A8K0UMK2_9AGAR|nr:ribonuclease III domain-containing protein [Cristinia sonorae]
MSYTDIQKAINDTIARPGFSGSLPALSENAWRKILKESTDTAKENDRLEFLGDALMYATIGSQLYKLCPQGSPHLYTSLRAALHSNATFSKLAEKLDVLAVSSTVLRALTAKTFGEGSAAPSKLRPQVKRTADLFETVIAAYYMESGFEPLNDWVADLYAPLIAAARKTYLTSNTRQRRFDHNKTFAATDMKLRKAGKHTHQGIKSLAARKESIFSPSRQQRVPPGIWNTGSHLMAFPMRPLSQPMAPPIEPLRPNFAQPLLLPPYPPIASRLRSSTNAFQTQHQPADAPRPNERRVQKLRVPPGPVFRLPTPRKKGTPVRTKNVPLVIDLTLSDDDDEPGPSHIIPPQTSDSSESNSETEQDETEDILMSDSENEQPPGHRVFS